MFQTSDEVVRNPFLHALGPEVVRLVEGEDQPVAVVIEALQVLELVLELTPEAHSKPDCLHSSLPHLSLPLLLSYISLLLSSLSLLLPPSSPSSPPSSPSSPPLLLSSLSSSPSSPLLSESDMLSLLLPLFVSCLRPSTVPAASRYKRQPLHNHALQRLVAIGPTYPAPFKSIMQASPSLRQQLENAIRASQGGSSAAGIAGGHGGHRETSRVSTQPPSIKLKMDFSNFK